VFSKEIGLSSRLTTGHQKAKRR